MDNLPAHKSPAAEQAIRERGAWLLFLPPYSPDLNPIEMAFAKLKAHLRAMAMRTIDELWKAIGQICDLFTPEECANYFKAAGIWIQMSVRCSRLGQGGELRTWVSSRRKNPWRPGQFSVEINSLEIHCATRDPLRDHRRERSIMY